jgi:hypothetical protein
MVLVLNAAAVLIGLSLIVGARRRWRWLVDPPTYLSPYYSQALLKVVFGATALRILTYIVGAAIVVVSMIGTRRHLGAE